MGAEGSPLGRWYLRAGAATLGLALLGAAVRPAEAAGFLAGWSLAAGQASIGFALARASIGRGMTVFLLAGLGGQLLRMAAFLVAVVLVARAWPEQRVGFLTGALSAYAIFLVAEIAALHLQTLRLCRNSADSNS